MPLCLLPFHAPPPLPRSLNCSQIESHRAFARRVCSLDEDGVVGEQVSRVWTQGEGGGRERRDRNSEGRRQGVHFIKLDVCRSLFAKGDGGSQWWLGLAWLGDGGGEGLYLSNSSAYNIHIYIPCTGCPINLLPRPVGLEPAGAVPTNTQQPRYTYIDCMRDCPDARVSPL